ncbi:putative reverse transcriptase domain-containing protein [Tanacetum coccineum]
MKKIFQRLPLGRGGSRGSFEVGVGAAEEGKVVCLVFQEWAKEQEEAFQTLKDNLCDTPILSLPDGSKEFVVYCDASNQGLGCVLMQRGKVENATAEMLCGLYQLIERKEDGGMKFIWVPLIDDVRTLIMDEAHASRYLVHPRTDKTYYDLRDMCGGHLLAWSACVDHLRSWRKIYFAILVNIAKGLRDAIGYKYGLSSLNEWAKSHVLWAEIGEIWSIGPELVQETTNKVILIKEKLKAARDCQKSYVGNMRKHLELKLVIK